MDNTTDLVPGIVFDQIHDSCHCCIGEDGEMYQDGDNATTVSGEDIYCCKGHWVSTVEMGNF